MKLIIASDIHGNSEYIKRLIEYIELKKPDRVIFLGDLFNYNNDFVLIEYINKNSDIVVCVRGNCDSIVYKNDIKVDYLRNYTILPYDELKILCNHGHEMYKYSMLDYDYMFVGHTHRYNILGKIINPGSVGAPRGNKEHTCILYNDKNIYLINLDNYEVMESRILDKKI